MLEEVIKLVKDDGFFSLPIETMSGGWRRVVFAARKGTKGQLTGHSFWITERLYSDKVVLGLWSGRLYLSSKINSCPELVTALLSFEPNEILSVVPLQLIDKFLLEEISVSRFNELVSKFKA